MASIVKAASAGTMESSDAYVEIEPSSNGLELQVESVVMQQFGQEIEAAVRAVLQEQGVEHGRHYRLPGADAERGLLPVPAGCAVL